MSKAMWVGRTTAAIVGLGIALALVLGLATMALAAAPGDPFRLGQVNTINALTQLVGSRNGPMLLVDNNSTADGASGLFVQVDRGNSPIKVSANSGTAANLSADKLDGKDVTQIGVNGLQRVEAESAENSDSSKQATASCPSGKVLVGTGFDIFGGKSGTFPNQETDVMMDFVIPGSTSVTAAAYEDVATDANWSVKAIAICATAGTP